ncbi:MAG: squalene synthase HpnC [Phycisphaeraceae bacterium]
MGSLVLAQLDTFGPQRCERLSYDQAAAYTRDLARHHDENFTVVSRMLPRRLRDPFAHVYAFCRWADDLGDEVGDAQRSLELLEWWRSELDRCYADEPRHPVFVALHRTVREHDIPRQPFADLIDAFVQDQHVHRYDTWPQVLDYCTRSANPVGRLVLYLCGYRDGERQRLSDATCTALQLTNFWQDVRRDILERDRVYVPRDVAAAHGLAVPALVEAVRQSAAGGDRDDPVGDAALGALESAYQATLRELVGRTWPLFAEGRKLWPIVDRDVRWSIQLFTLGGEAVLRRIERMDHRTLRRRPKLTRSTKLMLMGRVLVGRMKWT